MDWQSNSVRAAKTTSTNNRETAILTGKVTPRDPSMRFNQNRETMSSNRQNNSARAVRTLSTNNYEDNNSFRQSSSVRVV